MIVRLLLPNPTPRAQRDVYLMLQPASQERNLNPVDPTRLAVVVDTPRESLTRTLPRSYAACSLLRQFRYPLLCKRHQHLGG